MFRAGCLCARKNLAARFVCLLWPLFPLPAVDLTGEILREVRARRPIHAVREASAFRPAARLHR